MSDFIFFSSTDWHGLWGSRQQIAQRLARLGHRVLFIERPLGVEHWLRYPAFRQKLAQRRREGVTEIEPNIWIYKLPLLPPGKYLSLTINQLFQELSYRAVAPIVKRLGFSRPILWLYNPENGPLIGRFNEKLAVYHCIDEWTANTSGRKKANITQLEEELLGRVDLVFANSPPTYEKKIARNPHTYRLPSGVDYAHFAGEVPETVHPAVAQIPSPRIGYSGTINERLDYHILSQLADSKPDWSLILAGDPYPWTLETEPLASLLKRPNVYHTGKLPYTEMPHLLRSFDLCLVPYVQDDRGHYRSPLKLYEYLASGRPIIAVPTPENREFTPHITLAATAQETIDAVESHMPFPTYPYPPATSLQSLAQQHTWQARTEYALSILEEQLEASHG